MSRVPLDPVDAYAFGGALNGHHVPGLNIDEVGNVMLDLFRAGRTRHFAEILLAKADPILRNEELEIRRE